MTPREKLIEHLHAVGFDVVGDIERHQGEFRIRHRDAPRYHADAIHAEREVQLVIWSTMTECARCGVDVILNGTGSFDVYHKDPQDYGTTVPEAIENERTRPP